MMRAWLAQWLGHTDAERLRTTFLWSQAGFGLLVVTGLLGWLRFGRSADTDSGFKLREADRRGARGPAPSAVPPRRTGSGAPNPADALAHAKMRRARAPERLALPGISIQGEAHEILGVDADASPVAIQKAYRDLMKRYHPDRVGRPDSREWQDAQRIAEALNRAKDELMRRHGKSP